MILAGVDRRWSSVGVLAGVDRTWSSVVFLVRVDRSWSALEVLAAVEGSWSAWSSWLKLTGAGCLLASAKISTDNHFLSTTAKTSKCHGLS